MLCVWLVTSLAALSHCLASPYYSQAWLRGDFTDMPDDNAHPHEGVTLEGGAGWVGVGQTLSRHGQAMVRRVDSEGETVWTRLVGQKDGALPTYSAGFSIVQGGPVLYVGAGLWQPGVPSGHMKPAVLALDTETGETLWSTVLDSQAQHGAVRSVVLEGERIVCAGYTHSIETGFLFVAEGRPTVWELDLAGGLVQESLLPLDWLGQVAKIRPDPAGGFVAGSTAWGEEDNQCVGLVKLDTNLEIEWSDCYGENGGDSQMFDMLVDRDGNYLMGGHTTVGGAADSGTGEAVVNWDYLALKINSGTRKVEWRKTFGQPRGFDPRYIHDEMYGVALDPAGNYLLLGGSGDEYSYSETNSEGWNSDIWVSYLVVVSPGGEKLDQGVFGDKEGNNAGEWLSVNPASGDVMVYTDSDTVGGFGFLKLSPA